MIYFVDVRWLVMNQAKIYVGNLSSDVAEYQVEEVFARFGTIEELQMSSLYQTDKFAMITYSTVEEAKSALELDGSNLAGNKIMVRIFQNCDCSCCNRACGCKQEK